MRVTSVAFLVLCCLAGVLCAGNASASHEDKNYGSLEGEESNGELHFTASLIVNMYQGSFIFGEYQQIVADIVQVSTLQVTLGGHSTTQMEGKPGEKGWHLLQIPTSVGNVESSAAARERIEDQLEPRMKANGWRLDSVQFGSASPPPPSSSSSSPPRESGNYNGAMGGVLAIVFISIALMMGRRFCRKHRNRHLPTVVTAAVSNSTAPPSLFQAAMVFSASAAGAPSPSPLAPPLPSAPSLSLPPLPVVGLLLSQVVVEGGGGVEEEAEAKEEAKEEEEEEEEKDKDVREEEKEAEAEEEAREEEGQKEEVQKEKGGCDGGEREEEEEEGGSVQEERARQEGEGGGRGGGEGEGGGEETGMDIGLV